MSKTTNVVDTIDAMLSEITAAAEKRAAANTEPGGYRGGTSHPTKDVDDRTEPAQEGERSSENASDVKQDQPIGTDNTAPNPGGDQDSVTMDIGLRAKATGEDPSVETESAKGGKDDPGSSHPARTDNDELDGHKFASLLEKAGKLEELGRKLAAAIAAASGGAGTNNAGTNNAGTKTAEEDSDKSEKEKKEDKPASDEECEKTAAGDAAGNTAGEGSVDEDDLAKQAQIVEAIGLTVQDSFNMADKVAGYLQHAAQLAQKAAAEEEDEKKPTDEGGGGSDSPNPTEAGGEDAASGPPSMPAEVPDEDELIAALLGAGAGDSAGGAAGEDIGGEEAVADMLGEPAGAVPEDAPDVVPEGAPGEAAVPTEPSEEDLMLLEQALEASGVTPEEFEAAVAAKAAQAVSRKKKAQAEKKAASAKKAPWKPKTAAQAAQYQEMLKFVKDIVGK